MPKCLVCGHELPPGVEYCPPSETMKNNRGAGIPAFIGCASIRMEVVFKGARGDKHHPPKGSVRPLTDYQRSRAAYGKDCILSPYGPLPTEREARAAPVEDEEWGTYEHPDTNFATYE